MVSVAEGAKSAGESEGLGPSGRRPEPGAAGVLGKSGQSHRLRVPPTSPADQRAPPRGELTPLKHGLLPRARLGVLHWELSQCVGEISRHVLPGVWDQDPSGPGVLPDARPCSPRSSAPERPGCPGRPPGSERRCSEQRGSACALCLGFPAGCKGALGAPRGAVCSPPSATSGGGGTLWPGRAFGSTESLLGGGKWRVAALE